MPPLLTRHEGNFSKYDLRSMELVNSGSQTIRAIVVLDFPEGGNTLPRDLNPHDFPSRKAYRQALIKERSSVIERLFSDTKKLLRDLSLKVTGGVMSNVVIVEGQIEQIRKAQSIEGVLQVIPDEPIVL